MPKKLNNGKRFAFIDVYNTQNTTQHVLGFDIDWEKLLKYLKDKWECEEVFFYSGIELGDADIADEYKKLADLGYAMKTKNMMVYKRKDKLVEFTCSKCGYNEIKKIDLGYQRKSNCDVDMTMDIILNAQKNNELIIFTGDGDFSAVIEHVANNGCNVKIVSNTCKKEVPSKRRFSTKLRELFTKDLVSFININDWRDIIKKEQK